MARIRFAIAQDAGALIEIMKQYIETPITLEYEVPSIAEMEVQILAVSHAYPFLVIENDDEVIGFAFAHRDLDQPALSWNAELRAYINLNQRGHGYGFKAMEVLIDILRLQNVQNVYSNVTEGNPRSESLHRKLGFVCCGTMHKTGFKNGRWLDVNLLERRISDEKFETEPLPFIPVKKVDKKKLQEIFDKVNASIKD
ncbi:MAG: N-acetyltransferase [Succinivibrio sp.]|nr:N-acetyltransferase [Succinivibrio sp.]